MAGGSSSIAKPTIGSTTYGLYSSFPVSPDKLLSHRIKLPPSRLSSTCSLSCSIAPRQGSLDFSILESTVSLSFLSIAESFEIAEEDNFGISKILLAPRHSLRTANEDSRQVSTTSTVPWRDASLRYANVMWFKGSYNTEIVCKEDEPEDSIIRRFRRAVMEAGVIWECQRRRYRETRQDTMKRKQRQAAFNRRRKPRVGASNAWTDNAWKLSREHLKPADHNKKKKSPRRYPGQSRFNLTRKPASEMKTDDSDEDFWGYTEEEEGPTSSSQR